MKEAIGGVSIFQIVIVFLLLFAGIISLTINHSKAFGVKDEIINLIESESLNSESYELSENTIDEIVEHLNTIGHRITGKCESNEWIGYDRNGSKVSGDSAVFCLRRVDVAQSYYSDITEKCKNNKCYTTSGDFPTMVYYDVVLFYQLDIPVIKNVMNFKLYGSTKVLFG